MTPPPANDDLKWSVIGSARSDFVEPCFASKDFSVKTCSNYLCSTLILNFLSWHLQEREFYLKSSTDKPYIREPVFFFIQVDIFLRHNVIFTNPITKFTLYLYSFPTCPLLFLLEVYYTLAYLNELSDDSTCLIFF